MHFEGENVSGSDISETLLQYLKYMPGFYNGSAFFLKQQNPGILKKACFFFQPAAGVAGGGVKQNVTFPIFKINSN